MKNLRLNFFVFIFIAVFTISCANEKQKIVKNITDKEVKFKSNTDIVDKFEGQVLINLYLEFVEKFESDSLAPEMLYKAAQVAVAIEKPTEALVYLDKIIDKYNSNEDLLAEAYVYKAFIYETVFLDFVNARKYYNIFLNDFPNHQMYESIYLNLQTLGKTPEELIQEFLQNQEAEKLNTNE